ncbi:hypothetical protein CTheo_6285 [Ceratobasidium theobromae]|uniref:Phosphomethylpyrimidine kinase n=1 Tax=Ceratobasidium theobromae TaxID=1582974 RepID=A0A5N5QF48_9AGAM|nr:hypothetical protein CTheo_6285 [Ceratobasidium theobromae]
MTTHQPSETVPILTIAGTDPSGGAGIQADLKTFTAHGCYGMSAVTALVAQNTRGVQGIHPSPPGFVAHQAKDIPPRAIKTGMVGDEPTLCAVLKTLKSFYSTPESMPPLIVDPVMVAASGHSLLDRSANALIRNELVPLATLVTPNVLETELLLGLEAGSVRSLGDMVRAAEHVGALGPRGVLVKGAYCKFTAQDVLNYSVSDRVQVHWDVGCGPDQSAILRLGNTQPIEEQAVVVDALWLRDPGTTPPITLFVRPRLETTNTHGTGCTLSAALACAFAQGLSPLDATTQATRYTHQAIATAPQIGKAAKASTFAEVGAAATIALHIARESQMHVEYCTKWGVTPEQLEATPELPPTIAYSRYIIDAGLQGDDFMLIIAVASCLLGYAEVGMRLKAAGAATDSNPYKRWIDDYSGEEFQEATRRGLDLMESRAAADPPSARRFAQLQEVWERCTRMEIEFWDMGLNVPFVTS